MPKRKYDIGGNVIIEDDGHCLYAHHQKSDVWGASIGMRRPHVGDMPTEYRVSVGVDGGVFYLLDFADVCGFWLGRKTFSSRDDEGCPKNVDIVEFTHRPARRYGRVYLPFAFYDIRDKGETERWSADDEAVQDYLLLAKREWDRQELRFNEVIAHTGRDLKWIMSKIGAWVPFPPEPPPIVLKD